MNAALIDTNILIECFQHNQSISEAISQFDRILICPAVLGEFKAGIDVNTRRGKKVKALLDEFLDDPAVAIVPCTDETADYYARIFRTLKDNVAPGAIYQLSSSKVNLSIIEDFIIWARDNGYSFGLVAPEN